MFFHPQLMIRMFLTCICGTRSWGLEVSSDDAVVLLQWAAAYTFLPATLGVHRRVLNSRNNEVCNSSRQHRESSYLQHGHSLRRKAYRRSSTHQPQRKWHPLQTRAWRSWTWKEHTDPVWIHIGHVHTSCSELSYRNCSFISRQDQTLLMKRLNIHDWILVVIVILVTTFYKCWILLFSWMVSFAPYLQVWWRVLLYEEECLGSTVWMNDRDVDDDDVLSDCKQFDRSPFKHWHMNHFQQ